MTTEITFQKINFQRLIHSHTASDLYWKDAIREMTYNRGQPAGDSGLVVGQVVDYRGIRYVVVEGSGHRLTLLGAYKPHVVVGSDVEILSQ